MTTLNSASMPQTGMARPWAAASKIAPVPRGRRRPVGSSSYLLSDCILYKERRPANEADAWADPFILAVWRNLERCRAPTRNAVPVPKQDPRQPGVSGRWGSRRGDRRRRWPEDRWGTRAI